jgi:hypothetical protein
MQCSDRAARLGTGARPYVEKYGDAIWECICDNFPPDVWFKTADAVPLVQNSVRPWSHRTLVDIIKAVLISVEDQGNGVVTRKGSLWKV